MSIATDITGGNSSNQLMDLLAVVANPDVYKKKLDVLNAATAENKKYIEAVGPASEIVALREEAKEKTEKAKEVLALAETRAEQIKQEANKNASLIVTEAKTKAALMMDEATKTKSIAEGLLVEAQAESAIAQKVKSDAEKAQAIAQAKEQELIKALQDANDAKAEAEAAKADILAKHQAFVQGL